MGKIYLIPLLLLCACEPGSDWQRAPREYKCTAEQMSAVEQETIFCDERTGKNGEYCYGTALMRNCTKNKDKENDR